MSVRSGRGSVRVAEVMGSPGSGKTTVLDAISSTDGIEVRSRYRAVGNIPAYLEAAARLSPMVLGTKIPWRDRNRIVRCESSWGIARGAARRRVDAIVFDQGPLFLLKQLSSIAEDRAAIATWRTDRVRRWARALDVVVYLDAPNDVLLQRIRERAKPHLLREVPDDTAERALDEDRRSFERLLAELGRSGTVRIERLDTSGVRPAVTTDEVLRRIRTSQGDETYVDPYGTPA